MDFVKQQSNQFSYYSFKHKNNLFWTAWIHPCNKIDLYTDLNIHKYVFIAGIIAGGCADHTVRLRPALTFQEHHANMFLDRLGEVFKEL